MFPPFTPIQIAALGGMVNLRNKLAIEQNEIARQQREILREQAETLQKIKEHNREALDRIEAGNSYCEEAQTPIVRSIPKGIAEYVARQEALARQAAMAYQE